MKPTKLNTKIAGLINERLVDEYTAFITYQSISNWAIGAGYQKAGEFFLNESNDELVHARKIQSFLCDWNVTPEIPVIEKPKLVFKSLVEAIETGYALELNLYEKYNDICETIEELDSAVYQFLTFFLNIQTESVAQYSDFLNILEGCDTSSKFEMVMLENKLFGT